MTSPIVCHFCGRPIDPRGDGNYVEQSGWSVNRYAGGSNQLSLRKETGRYAHGVCMRNRIRGIDVTNQGTLI